MNEIITEILEMHDDTYAMRREIGRLKNTKEDTDFDSLINIVAKIELAIEKMYTDIFEASDKEYFDDDDANYQLAESTIVNDFDGDLAAVARFYSEEDYHSSMDLDKS